MSRNRLRILVHPHKDLELHRRIAAILDAAVARDPKHWDHIVGQSVTVDHYGYSTPYMSAVIYSAEPSTMFNRLTIHVSDPDPVFAELRALITEAVA